MKFLILSILIALSVGERVYAQANDDVRKALFGNDPNTTLTTGIGQVVQPVGIPVVKPLSAPPPAAPIQEAPKPMKPSSLERGLRPSETNKGQDRFSPNKPKVEGLYELGELPEKPSKDQKGSKKTFQIIGGSAAYGSEVPVTLPEQQTKIKRIRIPYSDTPPVQKIPYHR